MSLVDPESLPYRPCAGIVLLNGEGLIWIGRRFDDLVQHEVLKRWQMPQGGIDENEDPEDAARRELQEETGIQSVKMLSKTKSWIYYDLPREAVGKALKGKFRGQRQLWFAMRFTGEEDEIQLHQPGHKPEFDSWRWASGSEVLDLIVGFKRPAYEAVLAEFKALVTF